MLPDHLDQTLEVISLRILKLRHQLTAAREETESRIEERRVELPDTADISESVTDFGALLEEATPPELKLMMSHSVKGIKVVDDEATLTYCIPTPSGEVTREGTSVRDFVRRANHTV